mgnify:CR=1 FL=1
MSKTVTFGAKPKKPVSVPSADTWVDHHRVEGTKRLTLDISASLHTRMKISCATSGTKMAEEIREILEERYPVAS